MFRTIRSKLIVINTLIIILFVSISIILNLFSLNVISKIELEEIENETSNLYYVIEVTANDTNLLSVSPVELYRTLMSDIQGKGLFPLLKINLILILLYVLMYKYLYDNYIQKLFDFEKSKDKEFEIYKKKIESKEKEIDYNKNDIHKINKYITHELKNSLMILKDKVEEDKEKALEYIDVINNQIDDINALTATELSDLYEIDVLFLCAKVIDDIKKNIDLDFNDNEFIILGNEILLERVIYNIIENAFKYGADKVTVKLDKKEENVICKISNNGKKIEPEELDKIFMLNYRIKDLSKAGSGVGLALSQNIIELLNGTIYVESDDDITSFYISIKAFENK